MVQAGTAMGEAGEARRDTIQLQRGDMLLMVAASRHHGLPALPDSKDGLQGADLCIRVVLPHGGGGGWVGGSVAYGWVGQFGSGQFGPKCLPPPWGG